MGALSSSETGTPTFRKHLGRLRKVVETVARAIVPSRLARTRARVASGTGICAAVLSLRI